MALRHGALHSTLRVRRNRGIAVISVRATEIVRSTLPVVDASIGEITPIFYSRMFAARPDLERDLFNRGNQAQGDQQRALAGAIAAYAKLLVTDDCPNIDSMISRIANKHASLGITEDQYPIVYKYLFEAIGEVLGDAATPDVVDAWSEVYWDLAHTLLGMESHLYSRFDVAPGEVWRDLVVRRRSQESPDTVAFELEAPDGGELPAAWPGQYISVQVTLPDGARQIRQYSLTRAPGRRAWGITVKAVPGRQDDGVPEGEVSNFLHRNLFEGDRLRCSLPYGDLILQDRPDPLLLVSAGIGCTPIIGILHYLARTESTRPVTVLHADQSMSNHAHRQELAGLVDQIPGARLFHWYEDLGVRQTTDNVQEGRIDLDAVDVDPDAQVFLCGPPPFMAAVRRSLAARHIPESNVHFEVFGPDTFVAAMAS